MLACAELWGHSRGTRCAALADAIVGSAFAPPLLIIVVYGILCGPPAAWRRRWRKRSVVLVALAVQRSSMGCLRTSSWPASLCVHVFLQRKLEVADSGLDAQRACACGAQADVFNKACMQAKREALTRIQAANASVNDVIAAFEAVLPSQSRSRPQGPLYSPRP